MIHWDISDKEADTIAEVIRIGLEDAAVRSREIAKMAYLNLKLIYPKKSEKIKSIVHINLKKRLIKAEEEYITPILQAHQLNPVTVENAVIDYTPIKKENIDSFNKPLLPVSDINDTTNTSNINADDDFDDLRSIYSQISPLKISANLRAKRQTYEEGAITTIQAVVRGKLCRRKSTRLTMGSISMSMSTTTALYSSSTPTGNTTTTPAANKLIRNLHQEKESDTLGISPTILNINLPNLTSSDSKNKAIMNILKVKVASSINLLNEQLRILEGLDTNNSKENNHSSQSNNSMNCGQYHKDYNELSSYLKQSGESEIAFIQEYCRRLNDL